MTQQTTNWTVNTEDVTKILLAINECYPGKLNLTPDTNKIWLRMLRDLEARHVFLATYQLCATVKTWPPDVASVRQLSVSIAHGEMTPPTGHEAWEKILEKFKNESYLLTPHEKAALKQVGSMYDLKRSTNLVSDRAQFIKAFDQIIAKRDLDRATLPEVKALVEKNVPFLPEGMPLGKPFKLPPKEPPFSTAKYEVSGYVSELPAGNLSDGFNNTAPGERPSKAEVHEMLMGLGLTGPDEGEASQ